jgi:hypothetical protein
MDSTTICLLVSPVVSFVVSGLKKIPWIKNYPKVTAMVISAILGSVVSVTGSYHGISYSDIFQCILIQFSGAVATHEAITNQVQKLGTSNTDSTTPPEDISHI